MRRTIELMAAPTGMQPGGYVPVAFANRTVPQTESADLAVARHGTGWRIELSWLCPTSVTDGSKDTDAFVDAAALLAPGAPDAPWVTMGTPELPVEGALWRADGAGLLRFVARGLGSVKREPAPEQWRAHANWDEGRWTVSFELDAWSALARSGELAVAIWQGAHAERAGLKSVSPGWITVAS